MSAQRCIFHQHRKALLFQGLDAGHDARIFRQHVLGHIRQGDFAFQDLALDRALENLGQALHLRFGQRVTGAHAVAGIQVFDQVGRKINRFAVRMADVGQRHDAAFGVAGIGVEQMRAAQFALGIVDLQAVFVEDVGGQRVVRAGLEPALVRIMDKSGVGDLFAPICAGIEMVVADALDVFAQPLPHAHQLQIVRRQVAADRNDRRPAFRQIDRQHALGRIPIGAQVGLVRLRLGQCQAEAGRLLPVAAVVGWRR